MSSSFCCRSLSFVGAVRGEDLLSPAMLWPRDGRYMYLRRSLSSLFHLPRYNDLLWKVQAKNCSRFRWCFLNQIHGIDNDNAVLSRHAPSQTERAGTHPLLVRILVTFPNACKSLLSSSSLHRHQQNLNLIKHYLYTLI